MKKTEQTGSIETTATTIAPKTRYVVHGIILAFALLLRLYFVLHVEWFARSDTRDFHEYALNLLSGEGFVVYWNEAPVREGFVSRQVHSVGYPLFLAGLYAITGFDEDAYSKSYMANMRVGAHPLPAQGFNPLHALMANLVLDAITMCALIAIATRYFGFGVALVVQLLFGLYVTWTPQLISETLFISLFTSALALVVLNPDFKGKGMTLAFAIVSTLAVMTKPMAIVLYAFLGLWVLRNFSIRNIARASVISLPLLLFISAMLWRSHHHYGHMFISSTGAQHVATANYGYVWWDEHAKLRDQLGRVPTEWEVMDYFQKLRKQADKENPGLAVKIYIKSFFQMFSWEPDWHMHWLWDANYHRHPDIASQHQRLFRLSLWWYPLGIIGMIFFGRRAAIPTITILLFLLLHAYVSLGHHRYMAPVNVLFMIYSGAALFHAGTWTARRLFANQFHSPTPAK